MPYFERTKTLVTTEVIEVLYERRTGQAKMSIGEAGSSHARCDSESKSRPNPKTIPNDRGIFFIFVFRSKKKNSFRVK